MADQQKRALRTLVSNAEGEAPEPASTAYATDKLLGLSSAVDRWTGELAHVLEHNRQLHARNDELVQLLGSMQGASSSEELQALAARARQER